MNGLCCECKEPFGERSKQYLSSLCYRQQAAIQPKTKDRYGRTVARVYCAGVDANAAMARDEMAWAFTKYQTDTSIPRLEALARAERVGLWADPMPKPPWGWRLRGESRVSPGNR